MSMLKSFVLGTAFLAASAAALGQVTVPNTFTSGTPAKAADVNANFSAVVTGVNANAKAITALKTQVGNIPAGPQGPQGPQGPTGATGGLSVVDSAGKVVGPYLYDFSTGDSVAVQTPQGLRVFTLAIWSQSPSGAATVILGIPFTAGALYYASANCSGTPNVSLSAANSVFALGVSDGTNYWSLGSTTSTALSYNSMLTYNWATSSFACNASSGGPINVLPLTSPTSLISLGFTPPFSVTLN